MKKIISLLLAAVMLCGMAAVTPVAAESVTVFDSEIQTSAIEAGDSLAFCITMNAPGVDVKNHYYFDPTNATVQHNGATAKLVRVGVALTLDPAIGTDLDSMKVGTAGVTDVNVEKLYHLEKENGLCRFAVRVINIPPECLGANIYIRPYYVIEGSDEPVYVDLTKNSSVLKTLYPVEMPEAGIDVDKANADHLVLSQAGVSYSTDADGKVVKTANLSIENVTANKKTGESDWVQYTCYNERGEVIPTEQLTIGIIAAGTEESYNVTLPEGTAKVELTDSSVSYTPDVILPAIGSDIDVTKKKNRIRVSAADATFNEDGSIHVSLTFTNYTSNWITEETNYIKYSYYKDSTRKGTQTLYIGVIDTKKNKSKTFEFDVPSYTTKVAITSSTIVYWTEWA